MEIGIADGREYFFKAGSGISKIQKELKILKVLNLQGIPVVRPFKTSTSEDFMAVGDQWYLLYQGLPGKPITEDFEGDYLKRAAYYGEITGWLHQAFLGGEAYVDIKKGDVFQTAAGWAIPILRRKSDFLGEKWMAEAVSAYLDQFQLLLPGLPRQVIHRDLHTGNMLFREGKFSGILDFELCEQNIRIFDPCYLGMGILTRNGTDPIKRCQWVEMFWALIAGYNRMVNLTQVELKALWHVLVSIQLIFMAYFVACGNLKAAVVNEQILKWVFENKAILSWK